MPHSSSWLVGDRTIPSCRSGFVVSGKEGSVGTTTYTPVMKIDGFPIRIIARIEGPSVSVEFVAENELHLFARLVAFVRHCFSWSVDVYEAPTAGHARDLSGFSLDFVVDVTPNFFVPVPSSLFLPD